MFIYLVGDEPDITINLKFDLKRTLTVWLERMTIKIFEHEEFQQKIIMLDIEEQILFSDVFFVTFRRKKGLNGALLANIFEAFLLNQNIVWNNYVFIEFFYLMLRNGHEIDQLLATSQEWVNLKRLIELKKKEILILCFLNPTRARKRFLENFRRIKIKKIRSEQHDLRVNKLHIRNGKRIRNIKTGV